MFFDLNVPVPQGKSALKYTPAQLSDVESRVDLLVHLGYTVIAFNQTAYKKIEAKTHINVLDGLLSQLKKRETIVFLKRLTIVLDEDSEKGFGLINANASLFSPYDLISLTPTTTPTFSLACLTHSLPSPLTAHIISLPLTQPRLPFHLKHTLVRTAIKNGAVFEINYSGALGADGGDSGGIYARRNWWAAARELSRVTKGKGIITSGGVVAEADLRAPRDVSNLVTILGLPPDIAHNSVTTTPKALVLRARTRKTYRAVLSEPKLVIPSVTTTTASGRAGEGSGSDVVDIQHAEPNEQSNLPYPVPTPSSSVPAKRTLAIDGDEPNNARASEGGTTDKESTRKKKRKKNKNVFNVG